MTKGECERTLRGFHAAAPVAFRSTTFDIEQGPARFAKWVEEARMFVRMRSDVVWSPYLEAAADVVLAHRERFYRRYMFTKTDDMPEFMNAKEAMRVFEEQSPDFGEASGSPWSEVISAAFEDSR